MTADRLTHLTRHWHEALRTGDVTGLGELWAPGYTAVGPHGAETTREDDLSAAADPAVRFHRLEVDDIRVESFGDVAVVSSVTTLDVEFPGGRMAGRTRNTVVWVRRPEGWKAIRAHSTSVE